MRFKHSASLSCWSVVLCVGWGMRVLLHLLQYLYCCCPCSTHAWAVTWVRSWWQHLVSIGDLVSELTPWSPGSYDLSDPSSAIIMSLKCRSYVVDVSLGTESHNSAFWLVVGFCNVLHLLRREVSLMKGGNKDKYLECVVLGCTVLAKW